MAFRSSRDRFVEASLRTTDFGEAEAWTRRILVGVDDREVERGRRVQFTGVEQVVGFRQHEDRTEWIHMASPPHQAERVVRMPHRPTSHRVREQQFRLGGFVDAQPAEETHLDHLALARVDGCQRLEGVVECDEIGAALRGDNERFVERDVGDSTAPFLVMPRTRVVIGRSRAVRHEKCREFYTSAGAAAPAFFFGGRCSS